MKPAVLADRSSRTPCDRAARRRSAGTSTSSLPVVQRLWLGFNVNRKDAATVNREFFDWLSRRGRPDRPFFAFLNDFDAHGPYQLPALGIHRFGAQPRDAAGFA